MDVRSDFGVGFPVHDYLLDRILAYHGLRLAFFQFTGRVREVLIGDRLFLHPRLSNSQRRWLKGHALAHRLLHRGNHLQMVVNSPLVQRQECQAMVFTGYLFMGDLSWAWLGMTVAEAAAEAMVPAEELAKWCDYVSDDFKLPYADHAVQLELGV